MKKNSVFVFFVVALIACLAGCYSADKSASMATDNAASILREGQQKAWQEPVMTATPFARY